MFPGIRASLPVRQGPVLPHAWGEKHMKASETPCTLTPNREPQGTTLWKTEYKETIWNAHKDSQTCLLHHHSIKSRQSLTLHKGELIKSIR